MTLKLTGEQARALAYGEQDPEWGLDVESNEQTGTNRWSSIHELIVRDKDGKFWAATYSKGLTENQDESPFEYDDEVTFTEVEKVPVITYEYPPLTRMP